MERKREEKQDNLLPQRGNPLHETVIYQIGGTIFEVETVCGGSELLYDKMERLIKSETIKTPTDKKEKVRYNENSNLWCCIIKVDTLFSRILIYNHNQYENRRKTYGTESKIL